MSATPMRRIVVPSLGLLSFLRNHPFASHASPPTRCTSTCGSRKAHPISAIPRHRALATGRLWGNPNHLSQPPSNCLSTPSAVVRRPARVQTAATRSFTTTSINSWWKWFRRGDGSRTKKLPPLASFLDGSTPRLVLKASNEPRLRCTEFDENGNVTLVNGEFKKSELIAKVRFEVLVTHVPT